jgi:hypothetical protein
MTSILKVDTIQDQSGNNIINENAGTITIGASGDTITIPAGATIDASGATIALPTTIEVDTIEPQSGTTLTIGASGDTVNIVGTLQNGGTNFLQGITMVDMFRLTTQASGDQTPISSNLERVDTNAFAQIGTGMSESSGIFTFPSTGVYLVLFDAAFTKNGDARSVVTGIRVTIDNSTYNIASEVANFIQQTQSNFTQSSGHVSTIINVTSTANIKCRFDVSFTATCFTQGSTNENFTYMTFLRLGDSV